jgi:hypothetical protein
MENKLKIPTCWICMDQGDIIYRMKVEKTGLEYEFTAKCVCKKGEDKNFYPFISEFLNIKDIAMANFEKFYKAHYKDEEIKKELDNIIAGNKI